MFAEINRNKSPSEKFCTFFHLSFRLLLLRIGIDAKLISINLFVFLQLPTAICDIRKHEKKQKKLFHLSSSILLIALLFFTLICCCCSRNINIDAAYRRCFSQRGFSIHFKLILSNVCVYVRVFARMERNKLCVIIVKVGKNEIHY
jgi:hypothetical protein